MNDDHARYARELALQEAVKAQTIDDTTDDLTARAQQFFDFLTGK